MSLIPNKAIIFRLIFCLWKVEKFKIINTDFCKSSACGNYIPRNYQQLYLDIYSYFIIIIFFV